MNKNNAADYLPLVQALVDGKAVQIIDRDCTTWMDSDELDFRYPVSHYRIKPQPREKWFVQYKGGSESGPYADSEAAQCYALHDHDYRIVCYREVIE